MTAEVPGSRAGDRRTRSWSAVLCAGEALSELVAACLVPL